MHSHHSHAQDKHIPLSQIASLIPHKQTFQEPYAFIWLVKRIVAKRLLMAGDWANPPFAHAANTAKTLQVEQKLLPNQKTKFS